MGFSLLKIRDKFNNAKYQEYLIDTDDELSEIDISKCSIGSEAYSIESGTRYILDNNREWQEKVNAGGGQDGVSPTVEITAITGGHTITITDVNGEQSFNVMDGTDGNDGISPAWFTGTAVTGTSGSISATVSGSKAGDMYLNTSTADVYKATAANTWEYVCNIEGSPGTTPVKGTDYWTTQDQAGIVSDVLTALPTWTGGSY